MCGGFNDKLTALNYDLMMRFYLSVFLLIFVSGSSYGQAPDFEETLALAELGSVTAQYNLGIKYDNGRGVPKNDKTAVKWYTKAAEQGDADAQFNLGVKYDFGEGVLENDKTAVKWWTKAAEQGHAKAQFNLGVKYYNGEGVLSSNVKAYMWFNLAAFNGYENASNNKDIISKQMTNEQIGRAQDLSEQCLANSYKDC